MKSTSIQRFAAGMALATLMVSATQAQNRNEERDRPNQRDSQNQSQELQLCSQLMETRIQDETGQSVGTVRNMAVDLENGMVVYVIVNKSDDSKLIPVPFNALTFNRTGQTARLNVNQSRFNDAPDFETSGWNRIGDKKWGRIVHQHYALENEFDQMFGNRELNLVQARQVMDAKCLTRQREEIGQSKDIVVHTDRGATPFVLISLKESPNENRLVAVPVQLCNYQQEQQTLAIRAQRNDLANAPTVNRNSPSFEDRFVNRVYAHFDVEPGNFYGYTPPGDGRDADREQTRANSWLTNSRYGQLYDRQSVQNVQGRITSVEQITPFRGMEPGVQLTIRADNNRDHRVHLGPAWFIENQQNQFREGDQVQVVGSQVNLDGQQIIMANYVQHNNRVMLLRDQQGVPAWDVWHHMNELRRQDDRFPTPGQGRGNRDLDDDDRDGDDD